MINVIAIRWTLPPNSLWMSLGDGGSFTVSMPFTRWVEDDFKNRGGEGGGTSGFRSQPLHMKTVRLTCWDVVGSMASASRGLRSSIISQRCGYQQPF